MSWRWISTSLLALLAIVSALPVLWNLAAKEDRYNLVLLTVESTRADAIGPETTPRFWQAVGEGTYFASHRAVSAWTGPNVIAVLTGLSPFDQGVHTRDNSLPAEWTLPLEDLRKAGWTVTGLQAFMEMDQYRNLGLEIDSSGDILSWLARKAMNGKPFVLWYHYLNTHLPYAQNPAYRPDWKSLLPKGDPGAERRVETVMTKPAIVAGTVEFKASDRPAIQSLYLSSFKEFDDWFGNLWDMLGKSGLKDNTILVVTADHGDELLERGNVGHASTSRAGHLHDELARIPLAVWLPKKLRQNTAPPKTVAALSDHLDIMPTMMRLLGVKPSTKLPGRDLYSLPKYGVWQAVTSQAGFADPDPLHITKFIGARVEMPWKLHLVMDKGKVTDKRLYDLESDPGETRDVSADHAEATAKLFDQLWPAMLAMRPPTRSQQEGVVTDGPAPAWVFPKPPGGVFSYGDLDGRFRLEWTGSADGAYRIQYKAGDGVIQESGEIPIAGNVKDFGRIDRRYWNTWIVRYEHFRLRVGLAGRDDAWSPWLDLRAVP